MKRVIATLAVLAALGLAGAAAVVGFGLYNVSAQKGHLPGVAWVLHTTFNNSVRLRAPSMEEVPPLDDPDLIALGAGHYATSCVPCHGPPGGGRTATIRAMVPEPPPIEEAIGDWKPNELHWIVENGVKMSGMPAWPAKHRGDEVWSVVAYLMAVRANSMPDLPAADPHRQTEAYCESCHDRIDGPVPRLEILGPGYIEEQLEAYRSGRRPSGIMAQAASAVPRDKLKELARRFASESEEGEEAKADAGSDADPDLVERGARLARRGTRDIAACDACHTAGEDGARKGPRLAGQNAAYLDAQLRLWRDGTLDSNKLMRAASRELTDDAIRALAAYYSAKRSESGHESTEGDTDAQPER